MGSLLSLCLYPINVESAPNWVMRSAFERHFTPCYHYDWFNLAKTKGLKQTHEDFIKFLWSTRPEYTFMQLQSEAAMDVATIKRMAKFTKIINWTGDVKNEQPWYRWLVDIGKHIHITLFTNQTDVKILREHGCRADYLQVGFDNVWYNKKQPTATGPEIVFCANEYGHFPLSNFRVNAALALKKEFGDRFAVYGNGWEKYGIRTRAIKNVEEAQLYSNAKIALSISNMNLERYHSDRLLRIMACGCMPISHDYPGFDKDFTDYKNIVVFDSINQLLSSCMYYLTNGQEQRQIIADNAYINAHTNHTWEVRCQQLIQLLKKYN